MYVDAIIFTVCLLLVVMFFQRLDSFVYFVAIVDIALRILTFVKNNIGLPEVSKIIGKYLPESIFGIIDTYTSGIVQTILNWIFVIFMTIFLYYITRLFIKKKKI